MKTPTCILHIALVLSLVSAKAAQIAVINPGNDQDIQPNFQAAVNAASDGDVLVLPSGQFVVNYNILITKKISVKGQGTEQTILYRSEAALDTLLSSSPNWDAILNYQLNTNDPCGIIISGICFRSKKPCVVLGDGLSRASDVGIKLDHCYNFVITACRFEYFGCAGVYVIHDDSIVGGLINKCSFYHNAKGPDALGLGYGVAVFGANLKWIVDPRLGSSSFIFVEDNTFDFHRHSIAAGGCGLYVFRHNLVLNNIAGSGDHAIDAHAARMTYGLNYYGTRALEAYDDSIINTTFKDGTPIQPGQSAQLLSNNAVLVKSGDVLVHDNYIRGYRFGVGIIDDQVSGTQTYPIFTQVGYLSGLKYGFNHTGVAGGLGDGDLFTWNNDFAPYVGPDSSAAFYNFQPTYFTAERDFHLVAKPNYQTYTYPHPLSVLVVPLTVLSLCSTLAEGKNNFSVYPNPASNQLNILPYSESMKYTLEILDSEGRSMLREEQNEMNKSVTIADLSSGIYFVHLFNQTESETHKIRIEQSK